ncbi:hypothetical protein ACIF8T_39535 [Streptomyces sp. NPDC085946]|uniref:hypothetical protein n=1 Tax=Streptomyces sp. NPDC085946 TaxID=3365744 RepID=UPI0037CF1148
MHDEQAGHTPDSALAELRRRLESGLARARLNQTQLAARADLGRTTVSEALLPKKPVPYDNHEAFPGLATCLITHRHVQRHGYLRVVQARTARSQEWEPIPDAACRRA